MAADSGAARVVGDLEIPVDIYVTCNGQLARRDAYGFVVGGHLDLTVVLHEDDDGIRSLDLDVPALTVYLDGSLRLAVVLRLGDVALQEDTPVVGKAQMVESIVGEALFEDDLVLLVQRRPLVSVVKAPRHERLVGVPVEELHKHQISRPRRRRDADVPDG